MKARYVSAVCAKKAERILACIRKYFYVSKHFQHFRNHAPEDGHLLSMSDGVLTEEGKTLSMGKYYASSASNHHLIDRAFVASCGRDKAVVLIQDKLNKDVPKAVKDLNIAAGLIREHHKDMEVLCIVHVIGSGCTSIAEDALLHHYTLVRDGELDAFYLVNFSGVARFARRRKVLASA